MIGANIAFSLKPSFPFILINIDIIQKRLLKTLTYRLPESVFSILIAVIRQCDYTNKIPRGSQLISVFNQGM